jgi:carboxypeptidase Taq
MPRTAEDAYSELVRRAKETAVLGSCAGVLGWDERTYLPRKGAAHRAEQMALLARLTHERATDPAVGALLGEVESSPVVRDAESDAAAVVRELRRGYDRATKLPPSLVEELARTTTRAQQAWQEARAADDFAGFRPWLEKVVALKRQEAEAVGYADHPYDALLDEYEPGARAADLTKLFADLAAELAPLVATLTAAPRQPDATILARDFPVEQQKVLGELVATAVGFDFEAGRLDTTTHPFCTGLGPGDVRILTRYHANRFGDAFFGVLHEAGHGLYEQGLPAEHYGTPLGWACSLGVHESQSRLWENQVGRGRPFWDYFFPIARGLFPSLRGVNPDDFHFAVNAVRQSFIRVDADEATYNLHIIVRFELEQALLTGDLPAADVPRAWNEKFRHVLGLTPASPAQGCLQDIHWSMGGLGYFPTYTLGNLYAAQLMAQARHDRPGLDDDFRRGHFARLHAWLAEHVYRHGQRYRAGALCERITGRPLSHRPFLDYLRGKYSPLYGL